MTEIHARATGAPLPSKRRDKLAAGFRLHGIRERFVFAFDHFLD
jgi:hypothetical protein